MLGKETNLRTSIVFGAAITTWIFCISAQANTLVANFDDLTEQIFTHSASFTDGGITFFDPYDPVLGGNFSIENISADLAADPHFSPPNVLAFNGFVPGPHGAYGGITSFEFTSNSLENYASFDMWVAQDASAGNTITFEGIRNGSVVSTCTYTVGSPPQQGEIAYVSMSVSGGPFDTFEFITTGTRNQGRAFANIDNVTVSVPEPGSMSLVFGGAIFALRRRRP